MLNKIRRESVSLYALVLLQLLWEILSIWMFPPHQFSQKISVYSLAAVILGGYILLMIFFRNKPETLLIAIGLAVWLTLRLIIVIGMGKQLVLFLIPLLSFFSLVMLIFAIFRKITVSSRSILTGLLFLSIVWILRSILTSKAFDTNLLLDLGVWIQNFPALIILSLLLEREIKVSPLLSYSLFSGITYLVFSPATIFIYQEFPSLPSTLWVLFFGIFYVAIPAILLNGNTQRSVNIMVLFVSLTGYLLLSYLVLNYYQTISISWLFEDAIILWFPFIFLYLNKTRGPRPSQM